MESNRENRDQAWTDVNSTFHERCTIQFWVGASLLGESPIDPGDCPNMGWRRRGVAYFCEECGDIWGRAVLLATDGSLRPFEVTRVSCEQHFDPWEIAGSLLSGWRNQDYLRFLPGAALKREYDLMLARYDKEMQV